MRVCPARMRNGTEGSGQLTMRFGHFRCAARAALPGLPSQASSARFVALMNLLLLNTTAHVVNAVRQHQIGLDLLVKLRRYQSSRSTLANELLPDRNDTNPKMNARKISTSPPRPAQASPIVRLNLPANPLNQVVSAAASLLIEYERSRWYSNRSSRSLHTSTPMMTSSACGALIAAVVSNNTPGTHLAQPCQTSAAPTARFLIGALVKEVQIARQRSPLRRTGLMVSAPRRHPAARAEPVLVPYDPGAPGSLR